MNSDYPIWLDEEFVQKVLRLSERDESLKIKSMHLSPATNKGDNFGSLIFRAKAEFERENHGVGSKSLVVKVNRPQQGSDLLGFAEMFETEISMMMNTLSEMNQLLPDGSALSAKAFYCQEKDPIILVLEDLVPQGFRMIKRGTELDFKHLSLTIRNLARFHASSVALGERDPTAVTKYEKGFYHADQNPKFWKYFEQSIKNVTKTIAAVPEFGPRYAEKISKLQPHAVKKTIKVAAHRKGEFNVLCHGDLWSNNMLYRYDDHGRPIDHVFVDFQMSVYTSPAYDLHFIFGTSIRDDSMREKLLFEYHATLKSSMSQLNCQTPTPSLEDLKNMLRERGFLDVVATLVTLPIILEVEQDNGLDDTKADGDDFELLSIRSEVYLNILKQRISRWDDAGLLDVD